MTDLDAYAADADARRKPRDTIGKLAELLERSGIDVADVARINRVNVWQAMSKGDDGEPVVTDLTGIQLVPAWADGPQWPVVAPARPCIVRHRALKPVRHEGRVTVVLPDPQIGYRRYDDGTLDPMQDEAALDVSLGVIAEARPHRIVNLGDFVDLGEWSSKFAVLPEFVQVTQPALDRGHRYLAEQQAAAGPELEEHDLLEGNHDNRLSRLIMQNAKAALRLRQAGEPPESWPVISLPHLLNLDKLGVRYTGAYPAGRIKLAEAHGRQAPLYALHGEKLDMAKQAKSERQSTIQGHAHHVAVHTTAYEVDGEPVEIEAWSMGCLCRTDGAVPSTKGGTDDRGRPWVRYETWTQAVAVITETDDGWDVEPVRIRDGRAMFRGKLITAGERAA